MTEARAAALCGGLVVVLQQSTQPRTTRDPAVAASGPLDREEQSVAHALMVAFVMIVLDEFVNDLPERAFANEDQVIPTAVPWLMCENVSRHRLGDGFYDGPFPFHWRSNAEAVLKG